MIARIKKNGIVYDTVVFAFFTDGWKTKIIGFNETFQTLEYISFYDKTHPYIHQQMIIIDGSEKEWIKNDKSKGYDWIVNDTQLLKLIKKSRDIPDDILSRCLEMQENIHIPDWFEVTDKKSAENLLGAGGYFHDGNIEDITVENGETVIAISVWGGKVRFRLKEAELSDSCQIGYGSMGEIYDSNIFFEDNRIFWTDSEDVTCKDELYDDFCYFSASKMLWNVELN